MARLIDADALHEKVKMETNPYGKPTIDYDSGVKVLEWIDKAPTVDAVPVRYGQWECQKPCPVCGEDRFKGLDADIWADWEPPYCPNCGAKINGG